MAAASLCQLCQSIPFHDLPELPFGYVGGGGCLEALYREPRIRPDQSYDILEPLEGPVGFPHHPDLESLRRASAAGCELCRELERATNTMQEAVAWRKAEDPHMREALDDPTFDLRLTKRSPCGDGFWVVTRSLVKADEVLYVVGTFGFCAEDGEFSFRFFFPSLH